MPATKRTIALQIVATETHCGVNEEQCEQANMAKGTCDAYRHPRVFDWANGEHRRLPECIAAEKKAQEGTQPCHSS